MAPNDQAAPGWMITGQAETTDIGPQGTYVPGVRVSFALADGTPGSVFVPQADYTVDKVRKAVVERAATMAGIAGLTG